LPPFFLKTPATQLFVRPKIFFQFSIFSFAAFFFKNAGDPTFRPTKNFFSIFDFFVCRLFFKKRRRPKISPGGNFFVFPFSRPPPFFQKTPAKKFVVEDKI
jgi:hypothetical protein